ncbi:hypothetical protein CQ018_00460 [Arthrobacter sp. MYb227]|uniref:hypothetical protein n=1 Tax=Arthrobacter sp. MYb227 TaxID=1848601 RepID=UPI000CFC3210|nr:hypothetical protein [Arthrobacter sp. MYb227]PQZ95811.1 hypothetical protein CQ018_00460 [Arthrobacter sp. MYb227]
MTAKVDDVPVARSKMFRLLSYAGQILGGGIIGLGSYKLIALPPEQIALIGTLITLVTWLSEEALTLPPRETKLGGIVHGAMRIISFVGFVLALISLIELNKG